MKYESKITDPELIREKLGIPHEVAKIVKHQVSFFNGFSLNYIHDHYKLGPTDLIMRFQGNKIGVVKNQEVMSASRVVEVRCQLLLQIIEQDLYPRFGGLMDDLDLVIPFCFSDKSGSPLQHIPAMVFSKERYSNNILIPSINNLGSYKEYEYIDNTDKPLFHKHDKMCFAGSLTNIYWNGHGIEHNQRLQIGELAAENPDDFHCRVMKPPKFGDEEWSTVCGEVESNFPLLYHNGIFVEEEEKMSLQEQLSYKFQLCIDGHTCAWARLPWQMRSNSVPIKIRNPQDDFVEWFYYLLDPSKHFLEVDLHRLVEAYEYIKREPERQLEISNAGKEFVDKYLNNDLGQRIFLYTLLLLNQKQTVTLSDIEPPKEEDQS